MYTVRLADGTVIEGLAQNGTGFAREAEIDAKIFTDENLREIEVKGNEVSESYLAGTWQRKDLDFGGVFYDATCGLWFLFLREADKPDMKAEQIRADIEYLAMMAGVEL